LLINLEELILYDNQLKTIPAGLGKMAKLRKLDLRKNPGLRPEQYLPLFGDTTKHLIITTSDTLDFLIEDNTLLIKIDPLDSLPKELAGLNNLYILDLFECRGTSVTNILNVFKSFPKEITWSDAISQQIPDTLKLMIYVNQGLKQNLDSALDKKSAYLDRLNPGYIGIPDREDGMFKPANPGQPGIDCLPIMHPAYLLTYPDREFKLEQSNSAFLNWAFNLK